MTDGFIIEGFSAKQHLYLTWIKANNTYTWQIERGRALKFRVKDNAQTLLDNLGEMNGRFVRKARIIDHSWQE